MPWECCHATEAALTVLRHRERPLKLKSLMMEGKFKEDGGDYDDWWHGQLIVIELLEEMNPCKVNPSTVDGLGKAAGACSQQINLLTSFKCPCSSDAPQKNLASS